MNLLQPERLLLLYAHLLLCVFALQRVLATDWRVLRGTLTVAELQATHGVVLRLLAGLWLTGLAVAAIDLGFDLSLLGERPKLVAKLAAVGVLSLNGVFLRGYCFPRLLAGRPLARSEEALLLCGGAASTASWLAAAFFGIAKPLQQGPLHELLLLYAVVLGGAIGLALVMTAARWRPPLPHQSTGPERLARTWRLKP